MQNGDAIRGLLSCLSARLIYYTVTESVQCLHTTHSIEAVRSERKRMLSQIHSSKRKMVVLHLFDSRVN